MARKTTTGFNPAAEANSLLDEVAKKLSDADTLDDIEPMSSGLLLIDCITGGGIKPSMYTSAGMEQSAKTTLALTVLAAAIKTKVHVLSLRDFEGSTGASVPYVTSLMQTQGVNLTKDQLFGKKDDKGNWVVPPIVRYSASTKGSSFFNWFAAILRRSPDKKKLNGEWYYVYEDTKENAKYKEWADDRMPRKYGKGIYIPAENGGQLEGFVVVDSYPNMNPTQKDEDEEDNSLALQARMFSKNLPRVKGYLASKKFALFGVNQLRAIPMALYGPKEQEPGGQALRFNCMSEDTFMFTEHGMVTAKEYFQSNKLSKIVGSNGLEMPAMFDMMGYSQILKLTTKFGYEVKGKPNHRVLALRTNSLVPTYVTLDEISRFPNKYNVAVQSGLSVFPEKNPKISFVPNSRKTYPESKKRNISIPSKLTPDLSYMIGALIGDGYVRNGCIGFGCDSKEVVRKIQRILNSLGVTAKFKEKNKRYLSTGAFSVELGQWLAHIGVGEKSSHTKEVPWIVRQGTKEIQAAFLAGHYDTDRLLTTSKALHNGLHLMLLNFGILTTNVSGKEGFWNHGLNSASRPFETRGYGGTKLKKRTKANSVLAMGIYGEYQDKLLSLVAPYSVHLGRKKTKDYQSSTLIGRLPATEAPFRADATKLVKVMKELLKQQRRKYRTPHLYTDWRYPDIIRDLKGVIAGFKTPQERNAASVAVDKYQALLNFSKEHQVVWAPVTGVSHFNEKMMTYDGNMPISHTITTNGIVSHNSDVRFRMTSRSLNAAPLWAKPGKKDPTHEYEPSITGEGRDKYRYIHVKTIKNKLGGWMEQGWVRIWVRDANGIAHGIDPFYDTVLYLRNTGQLPGKNRNSLELKLDGWKRGKSVDWPTLKLWVLGSKEEKLTINKKLRMEKPIDLRKECFRQIRSGVAERLLAQASRDAADNAED